MNFIFKKIIKKVFEKYLNLQQQLDIESGSLKLPFGTINHQNINKKLAPFNIQVTTSIYKNLSIGIPLMEITSKPIQISIERFQITLKKGKSQNKDISTINTEEQDQQILSAQQLSKSDKNVKKQAQSASATSGYIKNMVNRLLYNMQILIQKVVIKFEDQELHENELLTSLFQMEFQITNLHLRNSLVLLEANIIKKIFKLQQLKIKHNFGVLVVNDFNICLDYNNKKLGVIAILNTLRIKINQQAVQHAFKMINKDKRKKKRQSQISVQSSQLIKQPRQIIQQRSSSVKQEKPFSINIYMKISHSQISLLDFFIIKNECIELKFNQHYEEDRLAMINSKNNNPFTKHIQAELLFKSIVFNYQDDSTQKDFLILRYLALSDDVQIFTQYQDNTLKSTMIKIQIKETFNNGIQQNNISQMKKRESTSSQVYSSTSFEQRVESQKFISQLNNKKKLISFQLFYFELMLDFQLLKTIFFKITKNKQLKSLFNIILDSQQNSLKDPLPEIKQSKSQENLEIKFVLYRLKVNVKLYENILVSIYGSLRGAAQIKEPNIIISDRRSVRSKQSISSENKSNPKLPEREKSKFFNMHNKPRKNSSISRVKHSQSHSGSKESVENSVYYEKSSKPFEIVKIIIVGVEFIQLGANFNQYSLINIGSLQVDITKKTLKFSGNEVPLSDLQVRVVSSTINSELSVKLIKNVIDLVPIIETDVKTIEEYIVEFMGSKNNDFIISQKESKENIQQQIVQKQRISAYIKINQINIKLGSLIKSNSNSINHSISNNFVWLFAIELSNLSIGIKNLSTFKITFELMLHLASPQTLHKNLLTQNPVQIQVKFKKALEDLNITIKNDFIINLNEDCLQILIKYFSQFSELSMKEQNQYQHQQIADNKCYFVQFYNTTSKNINFKQYNLLNEENNSDKMSLEDFGDDQGGKNNHNNADTEQNIVNISSNSKELIFWFNEQEFILQFEKNGTIHRSIPLNLQFEPSKIMIIPGISSNVHHNQYVYEQQICVQFEGKQKQQLQSKYVVHFLINSIKKIQKIILKQSSILISYSNAYRIANGMHYCQSSYVLKDEQKKSSQELYLKSKLTENYLINEMRYQKYRKYDSRSQKDKEQDGLYYDDNQFLLDLNEEISNIRINKGQSLQKTGKSYKIATLLSNKPSSNKSLNTNYNLFGIYSQYQYNDLAGRLFDSYIYQIKHLETNYFITMPFLIVQNSLKCMIEIEIIDKKTQAKKTIKLRQNETREMYPGQILFEQLSKNVKKQNQQGNIPFDFYNKQFTMKMRLMSYDKNQVNQNEIQNKIDYQTIYQSQQHYFNTFFMVEHEFQTLITLRSSRKYEFDKKYIFLREQLALKTKILRLEPSTKIINKTEFNFGIKFNNQQQSSKPSSLKKIPVSISQSKNIPEQKPQNYVMFCQQSQNTHINLPANSELEYISQTRYSDILQILFDNHPQTKIQVKEEQLNQGAICVLSFNFVERMSGQNKQKIENQESLEDSREEPRQFCHFLFKLKLKIIENHQYVIIENFITLKNLSKQPLSLSLQPKKIVKPSEIIGFPLPPTINKKFNNTLILIRSVTEMQAFYEELFKFKPTETKPFKGNNNKELSPKKINQEEHHQELYIKIKTNKDIEKNDSKDDCILYFKELLYASNSKEVSIPSKNFKLFSLMKDLKEGVINFFFLEKLFNPNLNYLLIQNSSQKNHFLMANDNTEYTHHFVGTNNGQKSTQKREQELAKFNVSQINSFSNQGYEQTTQKKYIFPNTFNIMQDREAFQLFLCDQNGNYLIKTSKANLQKQGLQMQFTQLSNFQLISISPKLNQKREEQKKIKVSLKTNTIGINIDLYGKISLNLSIKDILARLMENDKIDCLIKEISLKNLQTNEHILHVPEETYILVEAKAIGNDLSTEFLLIKNLFIKCKNAIINLQSGLPYRVISLVKNLVSQPASSSILQTKRQLFEEQVLKAIYEPMNANEALDKLNNYLKQKLLLIRNMYVHEIHLSLSVNLQSTNISNVIVIPQFQISNQFTREKNFVKEITEFYKTNILAKLPKLSLLFQSLKNPLNLFRTALKVGSALNEKLTFNNLVTFGHDEIPSNELQFSLQRWNKLHRKMYCSQDQDSNEQLLTYLYKDQCYYMVSNLHFIMLSINPNKLGSSFSSSKQSFIYYEHPLSSNISQPSSGSNRSIKWVSTGYFNSQIRKIPLKDLEKIKIIKNKKFAELMIQFKQNYLVNICQEYNKCLKLVNAINMLVM